MVHIVRAELIAALEEVRLALELRLQSINLEGDSRLVFEQLKSSEMNLSYNGSLVHEISIMGLRFARFKTQFVHRNCKSSRFFGPFSQICWT